MTEPSSSSLAQNAYRQLKKEILENQMPPGTQAAETEIATRLGMSRTPVHEALRQLQSEGLIELIPRRGARVLPIAAKDIREIYQLLTALDPLAAADVASAKPDKAALEPLASAVRDMERALEDDDLDAWAHADDRFHRALVNQGSNSRLKGIVNTLFDQAHRAQIATIGLREGLAISNKEHRAIVAALSKGDADKTGTLVRRHRERGSTEILTLLDKIRISLL